MWFPRVLRLAQVDLEDVVLAWLDSNVELAADTQVGIGEGDPVEPRLQLDGLQRRGAHVLAVEPHVCPRMGADDQTAGFFSPRWSEGGTRLRARLDAEEKPGAFDVEGPCHEQQDESHCQRNRRD